MTAQKKTKSPGVRGIPANQPPERMGHLKPIKGVRFALAELGPPIPTWAIYGITNRRNGNTYPGQTKRGLDRLKEHVRRLVNGTHHCATLQAEFDLWGIEVFDVTIYEGSRREVSKVEMRRREQHYLDAIPPDKLLNTCKVAGSCKGRPMPVEACLANFDAQTGEPKSKAHVAKITAVAETRGKYRQAVSGMPAEMLSYLHGKIYWILAPDNVIHCARHGLPAFCRMFRLDERSLRRTERRKKNGVKIGYSHHCGWRIIPEEIAIKAGGEGHVLNWPARRPFNYKYFAAVNTLDGIVVVGRNLSNLCNAFDLSRGCLEYTLRNPNARGHKGWILLKMDEDLITEKEAKALAWERLGPDFPLVFFKG